MLRRTFIRIVAYWVPNADGSLLEFGNGLFGKAASFATITRRLCFGRGEGLPGQAWDAGHPVMLTQFKGSGLLRADSAIKVGINRGFAIPVSTTDGSNQVMAFLSALATPIARRVEIWEPEPQRARLRRSLGFCELDGLLHALANAEIGASSGPLGSALSTGVPSVLGHMIALPIAPKGQVTSVMALHF